jgi:hypothetical protein
LPNDSTGLPESLVGAVARSVAVGR